MKYCGRGPLGLSNSTACCLSTLCLPNWWGPAGSSFRTILPSCKVFPSNQTGKPLRPSWAPAPLPVGHMWTGLYRKASHGLSCSSLCGQMLSCLSPQLQTWVLPDSEPHMEVVQQRNSRIVWLWTCNYGITHKLGRFLKTHHRCTSIHNLTSEITWATPALRVICRESQRAALPLSQGKSFALLMLRFLISTVCSMWGLPLT